MDAPAAPDSTLAQTLLDNPAPSAPCPAQEGRAGSGTSSGINISPGANDDGWKIPHPVRLADGTAAQLYKDGEALHAAFDAIAAAKRRICLEIYIFRSDATGRAFADLLCKRARDGISVYVVYDSLASIDSDAEMFDMMRESGVRLGEFHPLWPWKCRYSWRPANRDHRKLLVIDDDIAGLGGLNVGGEYAGSWVVQDKDNACEPWRDTAIGLRGPSARLLLIPFARTWRYVHHGGKLRNTEFIHNADDGEFGVIGSVPSRRAPLGALRRLIREARSSIELTMSYFAPPDELIDDLCRAARRKVRVRLMLPSMGDVPILVTAARSFYEKLLTNGVEIYERQGCILHAKTMCVDRHSSVIGSHNLDYRSIEYNLELSVVIRNPSFGQQVHELFENDVGYSHRITLKQWRRRPVWDRFVQWAVHRTRYLL